MNWTIFIKFLEPQTGQARSGSSSHFSWNNSTESRTTLDSHATKESSKNAQSIAIKTLIYWWLFKD